MPMRISNFQELFKQILILLLATFFLASNSLAQNPELIMEQNPEEQNNNSQLVDGADDIQEQNGQNTNDENINQPDLVPLNQEDEVDEVPDFSELESLMINQDEKQGLNLAIESYKTGEAFLFDDYEQEAVVEDRQDQINNDVEEENKNAFLHLATIIYLEKDNWTIWINDQRISSEDNNPINEIFIEDISNDYVDILWKLSLSKWKILSRNNSDDLAPNINEQNQVEIRFSLKPNQTFALRNEQIIEGKVVFGNTNGMQF